ncbi:MAG: hypothetical protein U0325_14495 [Polyangiales bacterium]
MDWVAQVTVLPRTIRAPIQTARVVHDCRRTAEAHRLRAHELAAQIPATAIIEEARGDVDAATRVALDELRAHQDSARRWREPRAPAALLNAEAGASIGPMLPRSARTLAVLIPLAACGPNYRYAYEGEAAFERCYALDYESAVTAGDRQACWSTWLQTYSYGANPDRLDYARGRLTASSNGAPPPALSSGSAPALAPTNPTVPMAPVAPPAAPILANAGGPLPSAPQTPTVPSSPPSSPPAPAMLPITAPSPTTAPETAAGEPPGTACANECRSSWRGCGGRCAQRDAACEARCDDSFRDCMRGCY